MREDAALALQRCLADDPAPPGQDPGADGRFRDRLAAYRHLLGADLVQPVEATCLVTRALLERAGAWEDCVAGFLASRGARSLHYRDLSATFLGWLAATGWGRERWPFLLQLAHHELLTALVRRHPGEGPAPPGLHPAPQSRDRLRLAAPSQLVSYAFHVHLATPERPEPDPGQVHLLAYRDGRGFPRRVELTPATAALLQSAQTLSIGQAAQNLGMEDPSLAVDLLAGFQRQGAILGFLA
jgi:hypothetical protein